MSDYIFAVFVFFLGMIAGYYPGQERGWIQYHKGKIVCEQALGKLHCEPKEPK